MDEEDKKSLRVVIEGHHLDCFNAIKEERKFKYDSEVIRFALVEANANTEFKLDEGYWVKIRELLQYDFVKLNHHIYDVSSFINKALDGLITKIESNVKSILAFETRSLLDGMELEVALAFIECQEESIAEQVDVDTLAKKMNKRNTRELREILENFVTRGLLSKIRTQEKTYYHAKPVAITD